MKYLILIIICLNLKPKNFKIKNKIIQNKMNTNFNLGIIYDEEMNMHKPSSDKVHIESPSRIETIIRMIEEIGLKTNSKC